MAQGVWRRAYGSGGLGRRAYGAGHRVQGAGLKAQGAQSVGYRRGSGLPRGVALKRRSVAATDSLMVPMSVVETLMTPPSRVRFGVYPMRDEVSH